MKISIFGLGYVGCVSAGCLAQNGHLITGVDINTDKVEMINRGMATIIEKDIDQIIKTQWEKGMISATCDHQKAVEDSDLSFICVGTPSAKNGHLSLDHVWETGRQIGEALKGKPAFHIIAIRSTVFPGTNDKLGEILERISGKCRNKDFAIVSNPEFIREGTAVDDYYNPSVTVIGSDNQKALEIMEKIYDKIKAPVVKTDIKTAELIKYINNSFHALKISFANEVGNICKRLGVDSFELMNLFCMDNRLNISTAYLRPGLPYGGSCLPKDLLGLKTIAHDQYLKVPVIQSIEESNLHHQQLLLDLILEKGSRKVGLIGLAFKKGTDDLRYSPYVGLAEQLIGRGYSLLIYDEFVRISKLIGANKNFIEKRLPHFSDLIKGDLAYVIDNSEIIVISHKEAKLSEYLPVLNNKIIIDLVRLNEMEKLPNYYGFCW
jgi:GDP-mannose 6-dehydrogenase